MNSDIFLRGLARDYLIKGLRLPRIWQVSPEDHSPGSPVQYILSVIKYSYEKQI